MKTIYTITFLCLLLHFSATAQWQQQADLPGSPRHHPVTFSLNGYGYVATGVDTNNYSLKDFYRYDPASDGWEVMTDFPGPSRGFAYGDTYNGKAYMGFGRLRSADSLVYLNDLWEYDPQTEQWTELATCSCDGRMHPAFIQLDGKIYVGLGNSRDDDGNYDLKDWWEYNIETNEWIQRPDVPGMARHHPYYFAADHKAYTGFGHAIDPDSIIILKDFYQYDPATQSWMTMNDFPGEARVAGTQFSYNGKGYILSGQGEGHQLMETGEFWEYDPATDSWLELAPHPGSSRWAPGSFILDENVYLTAGRSVEGDQKDLWQFDLGTLTAIDNAFESQGTQLSVFPNPLRTDQFQFKKEIQSGELDKAWLVDNRGRRVSGVTIQGSVGKLDYFSTLLSGHYYLVAFFKNGNKILVPLSIIR